MLTRRGKCVIVTAWEIVPAKDSATGRKTRTDESCSKKIKKKTRKERLYI